MTSSQPSISYTDSVLLFERGEIFTQSDEYLSLVWKKVVLIRLDFERATPAVTWICFLFFLNILSGRLTVIFCCLVKQPRGACRFWSPTGHPYDKRQGPMINSLAPEKGQCVKNEKLKCKYSIRSLSCCNSYCTCVCKSKILIQLLI